jgi:hypothetical protein
MRKDYWFPSAKSVWSLSSLFCWLKACTLPSAKFCWGLWSAFDWPIGTVLWLVCAMLPWNLVYVLSCSPPPRLLVAWLSWKLLLKLFWVGVAPFENAWFCGGLTAEFLYCTSCAYALFVPNVTISAELTRNAPPAERCVPPLGYHLVPPLLLPISRIACVVTNSANEIWYMLLLSYWFVGVGWNESMSSCNSSNPNAKDPTPTFYTSF